MMPTSTAYTWKIGLPNFPVHVLVENLYGGDCRGVVELNLSTDCSSVREPNFKVEATCTE